MEKNTIHKDLILIAQGRKANAKTMTHVCGCIKEYVHVGIYILYIEHILYFPPILFIFIVIVLQKNLETSFLRPVNSVPCLTHGFQSFSTCPASARRHSMRRE